MRKPRVDRSERREEISGLLRRMAFSQTALRLCAEECSAALLKSEAANREDVLKARYLWEAGFPVYKTLVGYEYQNLRLPPNLSRADLAGSTFIKDKKNLALYGPVGTGKTHLATALGVLACKHGVRTRFFTAAQLVVRLSEGYAGGEVDPIVWTVARPSQGALKTCLSCPF